MNLSKALAGLHSKRGGKPKFLYHSQFAFCMKIVHFRSNFDIGLGYDTVTLPLEQLKLGHDVVVVTTKSPSTSNVVAGTLSLEDTARLKQDFFEWNGLKVYRLPSFPCRYDDVVIPAGVKDVLEKLRPDIVQATAAKEILPAVAAKYKDRFGFRLFSREDQYDFPASTFLRRSLIRTEYRLWRKYWCEYTYRHCDGIFESSMAGIDFIKEHHTIPESVPIHYVQVCVDQSIFKPRPDLRSEFRERLGVSPDEKVLLCTGKVVPLKRFELLIDAMGTVPKEARVRAWIIGGGDQRYIESLKLLAKQKGCQDSVAFMDNVAHTELPGYYNAADMGFWNRSTSSIQEAMSCGIPVIAPRFVAGVLPEYGAGQVFADDTVPDLVYAISRLASDERHARIIAGRCLATAKQRFDIAAQAKEIAGMYEASLRK